MTRILSLAGVSALAAAAFIGVAGTSGAQQSTAAHPVACAFLVEDGRFGPTIRAVVTANENTGGAFELRFVKEGWNSANVTQSGRFALDAGETRTLGQASFSRGTVDAELTLTIDGNALTCRSNDLIDL